MTQKDRHLRFVVRLIDDTAHSGLVWTRESVLQGIETGLDQIHAAYRTKAEDVDLRLVVGKVHNTTDMIVRGAELQFIDEKGRVEYILPYTPPLRDLEDLVRRRTHRIDEKIDAVVNAQ